MMRVGDRHGERIRGVGAGDLHAREQARDHRMDLRLLRSAGANDCLLDESGGIFADLDPGARCAHQYHTARLAKLERGLRVLVDEHFLDSGGGRQLVVEQAVKLIGQCREPARQGSRRIRFDLPVGDVGKAIPFSFDQAPAGRAESRIEAEDLQASRSSSSSGTS